MIVGCGFRALAGGFAGLALCGNDEKSAWASSSLTSSRTEGSGVPAADLEFCGVALELLPVLGPDEFLRFVLEPEGVTERTMMLNYSARGLAPCPEAWTTIFLHRLRGGDD